MKELLTAGRMTRLGEADSEKAKTAVIKEVEVEVEA